MLDFLDKKIKFFNKYDEYHMATIEDQIDLDEFSFLKLPFKRLYLIRSSNTILKLIYWFILIFFANGFIFSHYTDQSWYYILFLEYLLFHFTIGFNLYFLELEDIDYKRKLKKFLIFFFGLFIILSNKVYFIDLGNSIIQSIINFIQIVFFMFIIGYILIYATSGSVDFGKSIIKNTISGGKKGRGKKVNNKLVKRKLSRSEKAKISAYKSVARSGVKGTKPFYKRKGLLICANCGSVGKLTCDNCGYESNKRKKAGSCPKCGIYMNKIYCRNCGLTQYLK